MDKITQITLGRMRAAGVQGMWRYCAGGNKVTILVRGRGAMFTVRLLLGAKIPKTDTVWPWHKFRDAKIGELDAVLALGDLLVTADSVPRFVVELRGNDENDKRA